MSNVAKKGEIPYTFIDSDLFVIADSNQLLKHKMRSPPKRSIVGYSKFLWFVLWEYNSYQKAFLFTKIKEICPEWTEILCCPWKEWDWLYTVAIANSIRDKSAEGVRETVEITPIAIVHQSAYFQRGTIRKHWFYKLKDWKTCLIIRCLRLAVGTTLF